jgi:Fe-S-cluster containining protein
MSISDLRPWELATPVDCGGCGACCLHISAPPFKSIELAQLPAWARGEVVHARHTAKDNGGPCAWFDIDAKICRNHAIRPLACRDFDAGGEACHLLRTHYAIA